jgi:hypothetical protein
MDDLTARRTLNVPAGDFPVVPPERPAERALTLGEPAGSFHAVHSYGWISRECAACFASHLAYRNALAVSGAAVAGCGFRAWRVTK